MAALLWTAVVLALISFVGGEVNSLPCTHAIAASADCLARQDVENRVRWLTRTLPLLLVIVGGYLVIVVPPAVRRWRSWREG